MGLINAIGTNGTSVSVDMTGSKMFAAVVTVDATAGSVPVPTDDQGNTGWVKLGGPVGGTNPPYFKSQLMYLENPLVALMQFTIAGTNASMAVLGLDAMLASGMFDVEASGGGAASSGVESATGGSLTPTVPDSVVISGGGFENPRTLSVGGGFSVAAQQNHVSGVTYGSFIGYRILTAAAAQNPAWDCTGQGNTNFVVLNAAFKAAVAGSSPAAGALVMASAAGRLTYTINMPDEP